MTLTFDLLTLKVVSESCVTWATSVPILVFLGLSVLDLGPMYATDRRQTASSLNAPPIRGGRIINEKTTDEVQYIVQLDGGRAIRRTSPFYAG